MRKIGGREETESKHHSAASLSLSLDRAETRWGLKRREEKNYAE